MMPRSSGEQRPMRLKPLSARILHASTLQAPWQRLDKGVHPSDQDETARQSNIPTRTRAHRTLTIKQSPASTALITPDLTNCPTPTIHIARNTHSKHEKTRSLWRQRQFLPAPQMTGPTAGPDTIRCRLYGHKECRDLRPKSEIVGGVQERVDAYAAAGAEERNSDRVHAACMCQKGKWKRRRDVGSWRRKMHEVEERL